MYISYVGYQSARNPIHRVLRKLNTGSEVQLKIHSGRMLGTPPSRRVGSADHGDPTALNLTFHALKTHANVPRIRANVPRIRIQATVRILLQHGTNSQRMSSVCAAAVNMAVTVRGGGVAAAFFPVGVSAYAYTAMVSGRLSLVCPLRR